MGCETCPVQEKMVLYKQAGTDYALAIKLATEQKFITPKDKEDPKDLFAHFDKTADTLLVGCKTQILCRKYNQLPQLEHNLVTIY